MAGTPEPLSPPHAGTPVLCLGAGSEQRPIILLARRMGLHVIAADADPSAPGLADAHASAVLDLRNVDAVIALAQRAGIRSVLPAPLGALLTTAGAVNDAMGLPGISLAAAQSCTDKAVAHRALSAAGLRVPEFVVATTDEAIMAAAQLLGFPVVLKPRRGSGSRGVVVARSEGALRQWLPWHLVQRATLRAVPETVVERFIAGTEIGVDGAVIGGRFVPLLLRDKEVTDLPFRFPYAFMAPARVAAHHQQVITATLAAAAGVLGLRDCLVHADLILSADGGACVLDMAGRPSGFHISTRLVPAAIGVDPIEQAMRLGLGLDASFEPRHRRGAVLRMLTAPEGHLEAVDGLARARQMPGVVAAETFLQPGSLIPPRRTGAAFAVGYVLTEADTRDEAEARWRAAAETVRFRVRPRAAS